MRSPVQIYSQEENKIASVVGTGTVRVVLQGPARVFPLLVARGSLTQIWPSVLTVIHLVSQCVPGLLTTL